jgi:hypothetical protein
MSFPHKPTLTAGPSCLSATTNYLHVPHPLQPTVSTHSATPSTPSLAIPTQSADSGPIGTEVCRFLILKLYIGMCCDINIKRITATVGQTIYFIITISRYMFRPTAVIISTSVQNVLIEYSYIDRNDIWYVCCL